MASPLAFILVLLAFHIAPSTSAASQLRGAGNLFTHDDALAVLCRITMFDTLFLSEGNETSTTEQTTCIPIVNGVETDLDFSIELPQEMFANNVADIEMGKLVVSVSDSKLVDEQLVIGDKAKFTIIDDHRVRHLQERHLQSSGTMTISMIRISTSDSAPTATAASLRSALFSGGVNFMSQYDLCSFGKLKWKLADTGVIEVKLPNRVSDFASSTDLVTAAQKQLKAQLGTEVSKLGNKVMMCLPPGTGSWAASAGVNHWRAQFNNDWCTSLSGIVHELGHTMGLLHANAGGVDYADRSGYMGSGYTNSPWPRKCFNGYNSWKLGWYGTRHLSHNPLTQGDRLVKLATFVDFDKTAIDESVVINISDKYFLEYNRAKGFNIDTEHKKNQVTVTESQAAGTSSLAGLSAGSQHKIDNFNGSGKSLIIVACKTMSGSKGSEVMAISIAIGRSLCGTGFTRSNKSSTSSSGRSTVLNWLKEKTGISHNKDDSN